MFAIYTPPCGALTIPKKDNATFNVLNRFCLVDMRDYPGLHYLSIKIATVNNMLVDMEKDASNGVISATNMSHINIDAVLKQHIKTIHIGFYCHTNVGIDSLRAMASSLMGANRLRLIETNRHLIIKGKSVLYHTELSAFYSGA
jgi:hypothetical protein